MQGKKSLLSKENSDLASPKPFLRWAGGKTWLLKHVEEFLIDLKIKNYHEPFLGSGAIYFHFESTPKAYLSDLNGELIETYLAIQQEVEKVISELKKFKNTEREYYKIRSTQFRSDYKKAARFIYLNQTSFNGIYRVNLKGEYNVPYGFRKKNFLEPENLRLASATLKNAKIYNRDFDFVKKNVKKGDLVFLDPPYTVTHNNNGFIKYNQKLFSIDDQYRLSNLIDFIDSIGAFYVLTNAAHSKIEKIFEKGHKKIHYKRASLIGGTNAKRGFFSEVLFSNI
ncbi:MAG TPA: Dam family site-specific DNA-(adenine-N6)-methyltransferase [Puia sp.]|nr:Dam family site-specific DNA-(adenine-N6)-methyltransferase [Puia sp.]